VHISNTFRAEDTDFHQHVFPVHLPQLQALALRVLTQRHTAVHIDLYDPDGCLRLQVMRYQEGGSPWCVLAEETKHCSVNALAGSLLEGIWRIHLQSRCSAKGCESACSVELLQNPVLEPHEYMPLCEYSFPVSQQETQGHGWLRGEMHSHTSMSDGTATPTERMQGFQARGGDFCAVTDHNTLPMGWVSPSIPVLRGMELTLPNGHFNLLGLKHAFPFNHMNQCEDVMGLLRRLKSQGVLCVLNHPCFAPWHLRWQNFDYSCVDALEIICDPTHANSAGATIDALSLWDTLLNHGMRIWGIGGSDCHFCEQRQERYEDSAIAGVVGDPSVYVFACRNEDSIINELKAGRFTVSRAGHLFSESKDGIIQVVLYRNQDPVTCFLGQDFSARLIADGKTVASESLTSCVPCFLPSVKSANWTRIELWHKEFGLIAFTNPAFNEEEDEQG